MTASHTGERTGRKRGRQSADCETAHTKVWDLRAETLLVPSAAAAHAQLECQGYFVGRLQDAHILQLQVLHGTDLAAHSESVFATGRVRRDGSVHVEDGTFQRRQIHISHNPDYPLSATNAEGLAASPAVSAAVRAGAASLVRAAAAVKRGVLHYVADLAPVADFAYYGAYMINMPCRDDARMEPVPPQMTHFDLRPAGPRGQRHRRRALVAVCALEDCTTLLVQPYSHHATRAYEDMDERGVPADVQDAVLHATVPQFTMVRLHLRKGDLVVMDGCLWHAGDAGKHGLYSPRIHYYMVPAGHRVENGTHLLEPLSTALVAKATFLTRSLPAREVEESREAAAAASRAVAARGAEEAARLARAAARAAAAEAEAGDAPEAARIRAGCLALAAALAEEEAALMQQQEQQ